MSDTSSATPRETLPVSTTSSTVAGSVSATACATERSSTVFAVAAIAPPYSAQGEDEGRAERRHPRGRPRHVVGDDAAVQRLQAQDGPSCKRAEAAEEREEREAHGAGGRDEPGRDARPRRRGRRGVLVRRRL